MERLLDEVLFSAPEMAGGGFVVTRALRGRAAGRRGEERGLEPLHPVEGGTRRARDAGVHPQGGDILIEALPYIREFFGKTVVVKYGGAAMRDEERMMSFAEDVVLSSTSGSAPS
jgi:hypothetical protein